MAVLSFFSRAGPRRKAKAATKRAWIRLGSWESIGRSSKTSGGFRNVRSPSVSSFPCRRGPLPREKDPLPQSGNQRFLSSIQESADPFTEDAVQEALFGPWQYNDENHSLGWDPQAQRLPALRNKLPERDRSNRSVRAVVFLATKALPLFPCFVRGGKLSTTGFYREGEEDWFSWPIWRVPMSVKTLGSLLAERFTADLRRRWRDEELLGTSVYSASSWQEPA
ncbi:type I-G CRISPR-associated protein, Cas3-extension family [Methylacidimicrobium cyclopophantes]